MSQLFCLKCNKSTQFTSSRPLFCSHCGKPYIDESNASNVIPATNKPTFNISPTISNIRSNQPIRPLNDEDISGDATSVPKLDKIECVLNVPDLRPNRQSAERVFAEGSRGIGNDFTPRPKLSKRGKLTKGEKQRQIEDAKNQFKSDFIGNSRHGRNSTEIE